MTKLLLIDGNSLINRGYYATPPLTTKDGTPTNAVFAFINMLVKLISEYQPTHLLVAFDRKEPTFRHLMYKDYKGTRKPMPDDLRTQVDLLKEVLDVMKIARYEQPGIEADDIIGTLSKKFSVETIIITGDKDSFQLVDENTSVYFTRRGISDLDIYNIGNFTEKTEILPLQIIDLKSMMGDSSDNIPGIAGVGEKTALSLLKEYGSLEGLYENVENLKGKLKERVAESREIAFLSKTLATINTGLNIDLTLKDLELSFPFTDKVRKKFFELEFKILYKRTDIFLAEENSEELISENPDDKKTLPNRIILTDTNGLSEIVKDCEISLVIRDNISFYDGKNEYLIKIKKDFFDEGFSLDNVIAQLKSVFADKNNRLVLYAKKETMRFLDQFGIRLVAYADDVSLEKYVLEQSPSDEFDDLLSASDIPSDLPAYFLYDLHIKTKNKLIAEGIYNLYSDIELPLVEVLFSMEKSGFKIDVDALYEMSSEYKKKISEIQLKIIELAGENFNLNSSKQLGYILFEKLGLKAGKKTKNGYSTNAEVLEKLEDEHEIIPLILQYRQYQKIFSTYIEGFKPLIDRESGLVHTTFLQTFTTTGRLSSREPNLQNIPVRDSEGKEVRKLFVSSFENGKIVGADYSQIELRLLAHFSGCKELIEAYNTGKDIHTTTASQVFGVSVEQVTSEMRRNAKAVNFGIIYGISEFGLSKQLNISPKRAADYIERYFKMYPSVKEYMNSNVEFAKINGFVSTLFGRKRYIRELSSSNYNLRQFGERAAMNMPLQGTAADIIKIAMNNVFNRIKCENLKSKLILQVHDELLVDTSPDEIEKVKEILVDEMQSAVQLKVPLTVEVECGTRWFDAK
ncbi:MAG: DNA polymerase I [Clostridia bacterium]|nr:DNA polymerase I [Clostridia bacterium]